MREIVNKLESMGFTFDVQLLYEYSRKPPPEAQALLAELQAHKREAILTVTECSGDPALIRVSETYKTKIIKTIRDGGHPLDTAIQCIAALTGDTHFYDYCKRLLGERDGASKHTVMRY